MKNKLHLCSIALLIGAMKKITLLTATILFSGIVFSQTATTTVDINTVINSNASLLFGITFDSRTSLTGNTGQVGYYNTNGTLIPEISAIFNDFPMSTLRYPANGIMQGFDWKKSIGLPAASRPTQDLLGPIGLPQPVTFGFDEFMAMTASKGVLPQDVQIMVNIYDAATVGLTANQQKQALPNALQSVADWVEYANAPNDGSNPGGGTDWAAERAANGHPLPYGIKIWNMGNEPWSTLEFTSTFAGCTNYLNTITPIIDAMLAIDPTIKITLATVGDANSNWNTKIKTSSLVAQGKIYGISPHYFPEEPANGVAVVEAVLPTLANTAQNYGLKIILGDYAPYIPNGANLATQDLAMQWGGANLCTDFLLLMSQIPNVERVDFWTYGMPGVVWHPIRINSPGNYTLMPVAALYKKLFPLFLDKSLSVINTSPPGSDGNPYSVRSGAFASNDLSQLNVISVNRDKLNTHLLQVNGISGYNLINSRLLTATGLTSETIIENTVSADINGNFTMPPMSVLLLEYTNCTSPPTVIANATATTVCAGTSVTLTGGGAASYVWTGGVTDGIGFVPSGTLTYTVTGTDGNSCTNTAITTITVNPLPTVTANATNTTVCAGTSVTLTGGGATSYVWTGGVTDGIGFVPSSTLTYTVTGTDANSCTNTATSNLTIFPANTFSQTFTLCSGQSLVVGSNTYTTSGTYTDVLTANNGCDSTVTSNLTILPANTFNQTITLCSGQSLTVGGSTYTISGTYTDILTATNGCDSTVTSNLTILPSNTFSQTISLCSGISLNVGSSTYTISGTYVDILTASNGCDSTVTTNLTILPANTFGQTITLCSGQSLTVGNNTYTTSGTYMDVLIASNGCDSTVTSSISIIITDTSISVSGITLTANLSPASYQWIHCNNGNSPIAGEVNQTFTASATGNYAVIVTENGCSDTSSCYNVTVTGITETTANNLQVFPNPSNDVIVVSLSQPEKGEIKITDITGREVYSEKINASNMKVNVSNLSVGCYTLSIVSETKTIREKIVIAR